MGRSLLSSECTRIHAGLLGADDSLPDAARSLITGHAVASPNSGLVCMRPAALAPTSGHHAEHSHAQIRRNVLLPRDVGTKGTSPLQDRRQRAGP